MKDPKIIELLKSFSTKEIQGLSEFIKSGYGKYPPAIRKLHTTLAGRYTDWKSHPAFRKEIYEQVYPATNYDEKKFRYLLADYARLLEDYLAMEGFREDHALREKLLRKQLALRNCSKAYKMRRSRERAGKVIDAEHFLERYQQAYIHLDHWLAKQQRKEEQNIEEVVENLDRFYLIRKLQLSCSIQNMRNVMARDYRNSFEADIVQLIGQHDFREVPLIAVYRQILLTLTQEPADEHFSNLQKMLLDYASEFSMSQLREMYQYAMNFCIKRVNQGDSAYLSILFNIYKLILPERILMLDGFLPQFDYKNIVTLALRLKELSWTKNFIEEYRAFLPRTERENAYNYNLAHWHFHRKEYSQTRTLFQKVAFTDIYYELDMRSILLKTYFEQDDVELFFYHASAFRAYIRRNKLVSDYQRLLYRNFILYAGRLIRTNGDKKKTMLIRQELEEKRKTANIGDIRWLLEKAGAVAE